MLALPIPLSDVEIDSRFRDTMRAAGLDGGPSKEAHIRMLLTRGVGDLSYDLTSASPLDHRHRQAAGGSVSGRLRTRRRRGHRLHVRNHPGTVNPAIKSNNLLNNALAMGSGRAGRFEGVMRNYKGELAECTTSNLSVVKNGVALTPPLESGLLLGVTRAFVFDVGAEREIPVREAVLRDEDLFGADEAFLTSTTRELVPIVRVDDRPIGSGVPGPVTRALLAAFRARARELTETPHVELKA
jgi:branched-chain amino acid aminotransferase